MAVEPHQASGRRKRCVACCLSVNAREKGRARRGEFGSRESRNPAGIRSRGGAWNSERKSKLDRAPEKTRSSRKTWSQERGRYPGFPVKVWALKISSQIPGFLVSEFLCGTLRAAHGPAGEVEEHVAYTSIPQWSLSANIPERVRVHPPRGRRQPGIWTVLARRLSDSRKRAYGARDRDSQC